MLTYCMEAMTFGDIQGMRSEDRVWYLRRLNKQLKREAEQSKKASRKGKTRRRRRR